MMQNRLGGETSPYLLQHKDNPVAWWAWGPAALAEAKHTNRPILLSVGYAACHWCHVMAHESFEDPETAALMNALFVNIKVDREERPDIDAIYMAALHTLGEHGGWPLTMFLTPDAQPFWGGTYFPKDEQFGRPSFKRVLTEIARIFAEEPTRVSGNATAIHQRLAPRKPAAAGGSLVTATIAEAARSLAQAVDPVLGGLRGAPKFPQFNVFWLLWQAAVRFDLAECRQAVLVTLRNLCQGGIYDHFGGGFARYSVDERWLVPHFEKMLYDNALLLQLLTEAFHETGDRLFESRIAETADWLLREMRTPDGAFASSYDADSEGEEGKFYVWSPAQVFDVLDEDDAELVCRTYDIRDGGNFEGHSIPNRLAKLELEDATIEGKLASAAERLRAVRAKRVWPGWDDKVLADWNGLAIVALAEAGQTFGRADWREAAHKAFVCVTANMVRDGRLWHSFRAGQLRGPGTSSDYANMIAAALALYQATDEPHYLEQAQSWERVVTTHFWIDARGGYALTADDTTDVIMRTEVAHDDAAPNANAVMVSNQVKLAALTGDVSHLRRAEAIFGAFLEEIAAAPSGHTGMLAGALELRAAMEVVIVAPTSGQATGLPTDMRKLSLPNAIRRVVAATTEFPPGSALSAMTAVEGLPTAYVCAGGVCSAPVTQSKALREALLRARRLT